MLLLLHLLLKLLLLAFQLNLLLANLLTLLLDRELLCRVERLRLLLRGQLKRRILLVRCWRLLALLLLDCRARPFGRAERRRRR